MISTTATATAAAARRLAAFGACCLAAGGAAAQTDPSAPEESPYSVGAGLALEHDSNIFRAAPGQEQADWWAVGRLFADADRRYGRQRVLLHGEVRENRYHRLGDLDNTAYDARLAWNGETVERISWALSHEGSRRLATYGTVQDPNFRGKNTENIQQTLADLQLGLQAEWVARLGAGHRRVTHSAAAYELEQVTLDHVGGGLQWNPQGPLSASVGPRYTRGRIPTPSDGVERSFQRRDLDFGVHWVATGQSDLNARVSLTRQRYDAGQQRDFNTATGRLDWLWTVTGKTRLGLMLSRETGSETVFLESTGLAAALQGAGDTSQLTNTAALRVDYAATGKISAALDLQYARRQLSASLMQANGSVDTVGGNDHTWLARLGVRWEATRSVLLSCHADYARRTASTVLSNDYQARALGCDAQVTLRWS